MKWVKYHQKAEKLAEMAEIVSKDSPSEGKALYLAASQAEYRAVEFLQTEALPRTRAILTVSAVALAFKSDDIAHFDNMAAEAIYPHRGLPEWARKQIGDMIAAADAKWRTPRAKGESHGDNH